MNPRSFLLGLGIGILVLSTVFYVAMGVEKKTRPVEASLTDGEIVERARKLGMIYFNDLPEKQMPLENPGTPTLTDQEIIQRAQALGMAFPVENSPEDSVPLEATSTPEATPPPEETGEEGPVTRIYIPEGSNASDVLDVLYEAGIIPDKQSFGDYLAGRNLTKGLHYGNYKIPQGADYAAIADILCWIKASPWN